MNNRPTLALVDGTYYIYRAYFGLKSNLTNQKGRPTNAIYGFKLMLDKLMNQLNPSHIAVVFDLGEPAARKKLFPDYKANRESPPDDLIFQIPYIYEYTKHLGIKIIEKNQIEADDIIGTLAKKFKNKAEIRIISADKDLTQLISKDILMIDSMHNITYDENEIIKKYGVPPKLIPDYLALVGDSSDNIPGVAGIGKVSAKKILTKYPGISIIEDKLKEIPDRERIKISNSWENFILSYKLTVIDCNIDLDIDFSSLLSFQQPNYPKLLKLYQELNFKEDEVLKKIKLKNNVVDRINQDPIISSSKTKINLDNFKIINNTQDLAKYIKEIKKNKIFCLDFETTNLDFLKAKIVGISLRTNENPAVYIPVMHKEDFKQLSISKVFDQLDGVLNDHTITFIGQNIKYELEILKKYNQRVNCKLEDTLIQSYLLQIDVKSYSLDGLAMYYFDHETIKYKDITGVGKNQITFDKVPIDIASKYAAEDTELTYLVHNQTSKEIVNNKLDSVYYDIEIPLLNILVDMEFNGVKISNEYYQKYSNQLKQELVEIEKEILKISPEPFNINSPKQLSNILFEKMNITQFRQKTKTGYSTDQSVLEKLAPKYPIASLISTYRIKNKLINTYLEALPRLINSESGRIHCSYNQTVALTGRLSSNNPNLQNIPIRGSERSKLREGFIADKGNILISADYSQIELRVLAHLSKDPGLIKAFKNNIDIHNLTASKLFNLDINNIDSERRGIAKAINFGLIYGMGAHRLSETVDCDFKTAKKYIDSYFKSYPAIKVYMNQIIKNARIDEHITTLFGRKRYLKTINSKNFIQRNAAERIAMNSPIQGTAADIIKLAMIKLDQLLKKQFSNEKTRPMLILQVHDELVLEANKKDLKITKRLLTDAMENACILIVPLKVNIGYGKNWSIAAK